MSEATRSLGFQTLLLPPSCFPFSFRAEETQLSAPAHPLICTVLSGFAATGKGRRTRVRHQAFEPWPPRGHAECSWLRGRHLNRHRFMWIKERALKAILPASSLPSNLTGSGKCRTMNRSMLALNLTSVRLASRLGSAAY